MASQCISYMHEFPFAWQVPNKTELAVYEGLTQSTRTSFHYYFPFPWASLIDCEDAYKTGSIFFPKSGHFNLRATASQHIKTI
jgi:hypothetical protein